MKRSRIIIYTAAGLLIAALVFAAVFRLSDRDSQLQKADTVLSDIVGTMEENDDYVGQVRLYYNYVNQQTCYELACIAADICAGAADDTNISRFGKLRDTAGVLYFFVIDREGTILYSPDEETLSENIRDVLSIDSRQVGYLTENSEEGCGTVRYTSDPETDDIESAFAPLETDSDGKHLTLYSEPVGNDTGLTAVIADSGTALRSELELIYDMKNNLSGYSMTDDNIIFAIDRADGVLRYFENGSDILTGKSISKLNISADSLSTGNTVRFRYNGRNRTALTRSISSAFFGDIVFCHTVDSFSFSNILIYLITVAVFSAVTFAVVSYVFLYDRKGTGRSITRVISVALLSAAAVSLAVYYLQTLSGISSAMTMSQTNSDEYESALKSRSEINSLVDAFYNEHDTSLALLTARMAEYGIRSVTDPADGETFTYDDGTVSTGYNSTLDRHSRYNSFTCVSIFDENGKTISTSGGDWYRELREDFENDSETLTDVLKKKKPYAIIRSRSEYIVASSIDYYVKNEAGKKEYISEIAFANMEDNTGFRKKNGLCLVELDPSASSALSTESCAIGILTSLANNETSLIYVFDAGNDMKLLYCTEPDYSVNSIFDLGLQKDEIADNYFKMPGSTGGGLLYCIDTAFDGRDILLTVFLAEQLYANRTVKTLFVAAASFILICILLLAAEREKDYLNEDRLQIESLRKKSAGISRGFIYLLLLLTAGVLVISVCISDFNPAIRYIMSFTWPKSVNVFSVSAVIFNTFLLWFIIVFIKKAAGSILEGLSSKAQTYIKLFISLVQYGGILSLIFVSLKLFGVKTGTVVTGAGILTIVVGLGANSLIGDLVAGLFIITEGVYRIGDIVTIDNFTGTIAEIGLRTTKIVDASGNIKTLNNAKINGVLNLSRNLSKQFVTVSVSNSFPADEVERLINQELPEMLRDCSDITEGPWYSGIVELGTASYKISVGFVCAQENVWSVKTMVSGAIMKLFRENEIKYS